MTNQRQWILPHGTANDIENRCLEYKWQHSVSTSCAAGHVMTSKFTKEPCLHLGADVSCIHVAVFTGTVFGSPSVAMYQCGLEIRKMLSA